MLTNHVKTSIRSLIKSKAYVLQNVIGLSSSLIVFMLIALYVGYELGYDSYHKNSDRIYRVYKEDVGNVYQGSNQYAVVPAPLAPTLEADYPEVLSATRVRRAPNTLMKVGDKIYIEENTYSVDPQIFEIFSLEVIAGDPKAPLLNRQSTVLARSVAEKYFGSVQEALGKTIRYQDELPVQVSAVIEDMPENSHFTLPVMVHFEGLMAHNHERLDNWDNSSYQTFMLLQEGTDATALEARLPEIRAKYADDPIDEDGQQSIYHLQPLKDLHFTSGVNFDIAPSVDKKTLLTYFGIAVMVLVIAGVNYVNLATARVMNKTREIGIRKVIGAQKQSLMVQFLIESGLLVFVSLLLAVACMFFAIPAFSSFVGKDISYALQVSDALIQLLILGVAVTLVSGIYPAVLLARFKPLQALKGKGSNWQKNVLFRNVLVIFQFTVSCALILSATVIWKQLNYIQTMDVGYEKDQIVVLSVRDEGIRDQLPVFKAELRKIPGVSAVASSNSLPNNISSNTTAKWPGRKPDEDIRIYTNTADYDYVSLYGLEVVEGRNFDPEIDSDKKAILLNETAVKALGWENPIGREMFNWYGDTGKVIGVLKDYYQHSLYLDMEPSQIFFSEDHRSVSVKLEGASSDQVIRQIEEVFASFNPSYPFEYTFFDEIFSSAYESEMKTAELVNWFSIFFIVIACLGLYGLAAHKVQHKIKEVGVRKVLGASISRILILLSKDFALLLVIAFALAAPLAFYFMNKWLNDFAYHVSINLFNFVLALVLMLLVAGLTVGYRTYRAAVRNPVESLREE
ncbi:ABC transporter permease [Roseivirga sp.]|uniref:ABC transporter permease n=1 Tax=Roseivirga sp. TaxID=1964215 RepID=UPI003B51A0C0